jgi:hypothetical protein
LPEPVEEVLAPAVGGELVPQPPVLDPAAPDPIASPEPPAPAESPVEVPVPEAEPPVSVPVDPVDPVPAAVPWLEVSSEVASVPVASGVELVPGPAVADELVLVGALEPPLAVPVPVGPAALVIWSGSIVSDSGSDLVGSECWAARV